jgi:hypothetical protein
MVERPPSCEFLGGQALEDRVENRPPYRGNGTALDDSANSHRIAGEALLQAILSSLWREGRDFRGLFASACDFDGSQRVG